MKFPRIPTSCIYQCTCTVSNSLLLHYSEQRKLLEKCAATALSSKLIARQKDFFATMVVDAVTHLDDMLPLNMIGTKKIQGGSLEVKRCRSDVMFVANMMS